MVYSILRIPAMMSESDTYRGDGLSARAETRSHFQRDEELHPACALSDQ
jgi:hypothetical protein